MHEITLIFYVFQRAYYLLRVLQLQFLKLINICPAQTVRNIDFER